MRLARIFLTSLIFVACSSEDSYDIDPTLTYIDLQSDSKADFTELFPSCDFVFLNHNNEGFIGVSVLKLEWYLDKIYILNQLSSHRNLLCFSESGQFLYKIDNQGKGSGEYSFLSDFYVDSVNNELILLAGMERKRLFFDLDGNYLREEMHEDLLMLKQIYQLDSSFLIGVNDPAGLTPDGLLKISRSNMEVTHRFFEFGDNNFSREFQPALSLAFNDSNMLYCFHDTIYSLNSQTDSIYREYVLDYGEEIRILKEKLARNSRDMPSNVIVEQTMKAVEAGLIDVPFSLLFNAQYVIASFAAFDRQERVKYKWVVYDRDQHESYVSGRIRFDIFNNEHPSIQPIGKKGEYFVCLLYPRRDKLDTHALTKNNSILPHEVKAKLNELDPELSNPVLMLFK